MPRSSSWPGRSSSPVAAAAGPDCVDGLGITVTRPYPPAAPRPAYVRSRRRPSRSVAVLPDVPAGTLHPGGGPGHTAGEPDTVLPRLPTHRLPDDACRSEASVSFVLAGSSRSRLRRDRAQAQPRQGARGRHHVGALLAAAVRRLVKLDHTEAALALAEAAIVRMLGNANCRGGHRTRRFRRPLRRADEPGGLRKPNGHQRLRNQYELPGHLFSPPHSPTSCLRAWCAMLSK